MKMLFLINTSVEEDFPEEEMPKASGRKILRKEGTDRRTRKMNLPNFLKRKRQKKNDRTKEVGADIK